MLDNTINKVAEEVLSPEELEERQLKIQVSSDLEKNLIFLLLQLSFVFDLLINKPWKELRDIEFSCTYRNDSI